MTILIVLVITSLTLSVGFLIAFLWAVKSGQFDDTYTPSVRILLDGKRTENNRNNKSKN
ncbi:cbb3-type cytochrome oxidase assembly protein CcoS [bacterium]|nr:cbb3-type cytochrome oxidase assembly protein CcoS [bacterium]